MVAQATTRSELVRMLVLNEICDDYENLAVSIEMPIKERGGRCGLYIEKEEIVEALTELFDLGWAKAYHLDGERTTVFKTMPSLTEMEDFSGAWFYRTEEGLRAQLENWEPWPFDDDDELKKNWTPPEN
jgi:hypothetical protein